jgi:hypothetical protein
MWVYGSTGFYSVVMASDDFDVLVVGGRVRRDMVRLQKLLSVLGHGPHEILEDAWSDYRFRVRLSRSAYAEAVAALVTAIDYESLIWAVSEVQGEHRTSVYQKLALITHTLTEVEDGG